MKMEDLKNSLLEETEKWLKKIEDVKIEIKSPKGEEFFQNIEAYISDARYFMEKGDLIRAFESVVWAWAWLEIGKEMKLLDFEEIK